jgi:hypothetical protein
MKVNLTAALTFGHRGEKLMHNHVFTALSIVVLVFVIQANSASGQTALNNDPSARLQTQIARFGTGEKAKVTVRKNDGTKVKGYISRTGDAAFDLTDPKTKQTSAIAYSDVSKIKKQGMSTGLKIAIIGGVAAAVVVVVAAIAVKEAFDDGCFLGCPE